jgi:hypothetical protein
MPAATSWIESKNGSSILRLLQTESKAAIFCLSCLVAVSRSSNSRSRVSESFLDSCQMNSMKNGSDGFASSELH